eukprot:TRINITY_DN9904_c0_g1_i1.p1 TRINITY_DN9904_c0_g1~~TRINITY_DN9904_c0_g1_i1.p1  ORF type:complete len:441 (+),score=70.31 TRINITY_DN9904_c0_g1_i1:91-1323(+)
MSVKDMLPMYYKRLFPYEQMFQWLSYGGDREYFGRREWSFTINAIYSRYNCYTSLEEFKKDILKRMPHKMDIGAVFNTAPTNHVRVQNFKPEEKELVFDIDATDYEDVIVLPEKTDYITSTTWPLMAVTVETLYDVLHNDFGFEHILFVFSGRRGVHAWVCDRRARQLGNQARAAIAEYLQVVMETAGKKVNLKPNLHPTLKRVYQNICLPVFVKTLVCEQNLFTNPDHIEKILSFAPNDTIREEARRRWALEDSSSEQRWNEFSASCKQFMAKARFAKSHPLHDLVFTYTYPRLDINVSKQLNHLLKSPFVIHPKTGRVCTPFAASEAYTFRPEDVPTVRSMLKEIDEYDAKNGTNDVPDYKKTSLAKPVAVFEEFLKGVIAEQKKHTEAIKKMKADPGDAMDVDIEDM